MVSKVKEDKAKQAASAPAEAPVAQPQADAGLTLVDLSSIAQLIDLASSRGAYRAAEFEQVGAIYTKLANFLRNAQLASEQAQAQAATQQAAQPTPEAAAE